MCALSYTLQVDQLERMWAIDFQAAVAVRVAGGKCEVPVLANVREGFEVALRATPVATDPKRALMRRALGLD